MMLANSIFSNPADIVFFSAIGGIIVLFLIIFIVSKIVQKQRDKKYEAEFNARLAEQQALQEQQDSKPEATESVEEQTESAVEEQPEVVKSVEEQTESAVEKQPEATESVEEQTESVAEKQPEATESVEEQTESVVEEQPEVTESVEEQTESVVEEQPEVAESVEEQTESAVEEKPEATVTVAEENVKATPKSKSATKPEKPKGRTYNGKYEIYPDGDGYRYRLKASNGEVLIVSEVYASHEGVLKAIGAVKRNVESGEIRIIEDKHGMFKFKLTSKNYRVLALGSNYSTEKSAIRASESFKKFAVKADIVEVSANAEADLISSVVEINLEENKTGGKFVIERFNGEFSWDLLASNGQILCQAEGYTSKAGVMSSIESFRRNIENGVFKVVKDKNDNYHYNLYTPSGRVAAVGETYNTRALAESAVHSVVSYYKNAEIVEKTKKVK